MEKGIVSTEQEPKMKNRFVVEFPEKFEIESYLVQKINKPKFKDGKWENIEIIFIDVVSPFSTSDGLYNIVKFLKKEESQKEKVLFSFNIKTLDPSGETVETWLINVEEVLNINFGELDYEINELLMPSLLIKPLNCILNN
jgi:hypothetical protein